MAQVVRKITPEILKQMIIQEARKLQKEVAQEKAARPEDVKADEVEPDEIADTLANKIDYLKALKIHENKLQAKLEKLQEAKRKLAKDIAQKRAASK